MSEPDVGPPPDSAIAYVADMLSELADMASLNGYRSVAVSIRLAALQALNARVDNERASRAADPSREPLRDALGACDEPTRQ